MYKCKRVVVIFFLLESCVKLPKRKIVGPIFQNIGSFSTILRATKNKPYQRKMGVSIFLLGRFLSKFGDDP